MVELMDILLVCVSYSVYLQMKVDIFTNSLKLSPSIEANSHTDHQEIPLFCMEPEDALPYLQGL
jgi:hypothetical protein